MALYAFDGTVQNDSNAGNDWAAVAGQTNIHRFFSRSSQASELNPCPPGDASSRRSYF